MSKKKKKKSNLVWTKQKENKPWQYSSSRIVLENNAGHISMNDLMTLLLAW